MKTPVTNQESKNYFADDYDEDEIEQYESGDYETVDEFDNRDEEYDEMYDEDDDDYLKVVYVPDYSTP